MLRNIERYNGFVVQKITKIKGATVGYQTGLESDIGQSGKWERFNSLSAARAHLGIPKATSDPHNVPKATLPHNQKGYRADNQKARK